VKENWLQLQMSSLHELNRDDETLAVLEKLLISFPSKTYWKDMLTNVKNAGGLTDRGHVELFRLKRAAEVLEPSEMVEMAELSMAIGVPGDAKSILESGFASKELGAGASKDRENRLLNKARADSAADQKTLDAQAQQAANAAKGDLDTKIGEAYASYGQYDKAVEAITRGLKKGGVTAEDEANLHLGEALFASKKYVEAASAFKAVKSDSKYARIARLWAILANNKK
jgi:tetratricopeptide (TPR) repeat protein